MAVTINGTTGIETNTDTGKVKVGGNDDLQIYHDGSDSCIENITNDLVLKTTGSGDDINIVSNDDVWIGVNGTEDGIKVIGDGAVELYYDNSKKLETYTSGITVQGHIKANQDDSQLILGAGNDLKIYHTSGYNQIESHNGPIQIRSATDSMIKAIPDGAVELYYDNSKKFETDTDGVSVTGVLHAHVNVGDSDYTSHTWHTLQSNTNNNTALIVEHSGDTNPYGIFIDFSDHDPDNTTNYFVRGMDSSNNAKFAIYSDGDVWTSDASTLTSDETLKENIVDATPKLEDLKKLKVRNFNWKPSFHSEKSKKKQLGFIAQEVEEVFPALVQEYDIAAGLPDDGHTPVMKKSIKQAWDPIIIKAMQELIAKVETLETEVNTLKTKVAALEAA